MSKLSPEQIRKALVASNNVRPSVLSSIPLYRTDKVEDSKARAISARREECKVNKEAQK